MADINARVSVNQLSVGSSASIGTIFPSGGGTKDYNKLKNKPLTLDQDETGYDGVEGLEYRIWELLNHPDFAKVAFSGNYGDLFNKPDLSKKQNKLVSGVNIKTVNHETLLGSGNVDIENPPETYEHSQLVPERVWHVTHNLDKYPSVTVVDSAENVVVGEVVYIDNNTVEMTFQGAFSGKAYFN